MVQRDGLTIAIIHSDKFSLENWFFTGLIAQVSGLQVLEKVPQTEGLSHRQIPFLAWSLAPARQQVVTI